MSKPSKVEVPSLTANIAITGTASFLGSTLLKVLDTSNSKKTILALDKKPPPFPLKKAKWFKIDLTEVGVDQKLVAIFKKFRPKILVHAALLDHPIKNIETAHEIQVIGTLHLLTAAHASPLHKLILCSTTDVYGAFPNNPNFLTEAHLPRGGSLSPFLKDKVEVEKLFLQFGKVHPHRVVTILRPATLLGPTVNNFKSHFFEHPFIPTVFGFDPLVQFIHEMDCLRTLLKVIGEDHSGVFNLVAQGVLPLSRAIRILNKIPLPIPSFLLYPSQELLWYLNMSLSPGSHINFLKYLCIADGAKAWRQLRTTPIYTSQEALLSFMGKSLDVKTLTAKLKNETTHAKLGKTI